MRAKEINFFKCQMKKADLNEARVAGENQKPNAQKTAVPNLNKRKI